MMNTKLSTKWKKISVIVMGMFGLATLSFNCAPTLFEAQKGSGGSFFDSFSVFESTNAPLTLLTAEQTYQSMLNVTGQSAGSNSVARTEYLSRFGSMSSTATLTNMNSPLMLASTSLGGDVCNSLVTAETAAGATRRFFASVNFGAAPDINAVNASASQMAQAFWGRAITGEELAAIGSFYQEMVTGATPNGALTRAIILGTCASMISSFDSLVY